MIREEIDKNQIGNRRTNGRSVIADPLFKINGDDLKIPGVKISGDRTLAVVTSHMAAVSVLIFIVDGLNPEIQFSTSVHSL